MNKHLTPARIALLYAVFASIWIFASDNLLALASLEPSSIVNLSLFKGLSFVFITTWLLYQLTKTLLARGALSDEARTLTTGVFEGRKLFFIFLALALIVPLFGFSIAKFYGPKVREETFNDLIAIAELKAVQVETWLKERNSDAEMLAENRNFSDRAEQFLIQGDAKAKAFLHNRLATLARLHRYDPVLLYADGRRALSSEIQPDLIADSIWHNLLTSATLSGKVQHSDLYRDSGGRIRLDYLIPLRLSSPQRTVGAVVLRAPVEDFLFPLIQSWPTASPSAETVLARRDGNQVMFLNELRHRKGTALKFRLPLDSKDLPIAVSILDNKSQILEGNDYRGVRVLAATRPIKGIDWHLVAKVDRDEVMALLNEMLLVITLVAIIAILAVASAVLMLWRQQQHLHQIELIARTAEQDKQLKLFYDLPFIGMAFSSPETKAWLYANDHLCEMLGYSREELLQTTWADISHPADLAANNTLFERMIGGEIDGYTLEKRFIRKDGSLITVNLDVKCTRGADGKAEHIVAMIEDITEQKRSQDALRLSATVFESSHDGIMITDIKGNILAVNRSFAKITGYSESEVLGESSRILQSGRQNKDFYQSMWANIMQAGYWHGELWNRRKNGEIYPEWLTISVVKNTQGITTHYVGTFSDLSQLKQSETQLEHLAHYDPLTDLPNRLLVQSHLTHALAHAKRHRRLVGILYFDLDRFKNINESLGYPIGDELLIKLSERLTMHMRSEDILARLGGDEFLLVLEHMESPEDAATVARSMLETLAHPFVLSGENEIYIGASIGISVFPNDSSSADQLIQYADSAMHQAKQQGRNTYLFYTEALTRSSGKHLEMESRLRHAISANQLCVYYQPQVDIATRRIVGAEALVRWQDPERGLITPANFIPLAEETGLISIIGEWVLKEACLQGKRWIESGVPFFTLAVNISPHQFQRGNIVDSVSKILLETEFPAGRLELELTESALMQQEENAVRMLHLLRAQEIRLAIDDFGTGYSSLAYLKRFPLDILKIDKSFVDDIPFHLDDMEIAATIIAMGHSLGFKVLAEGVETIDQLNFLQAKGCDMYQGYLTSPAVPAEEFEKLLKQYMSSSSATDYLDEVH
jgi:diguanylate cyclase (GGDEF)-like protein/PAS domain S-box-containing protein